MCAEKKVFKKKPSWKPSISRWKICSIMDLELEEPERLLTEIIASEEAYVHIVVVWDEGAGESVEE